MSWPKLIYLLNNILIWTENHLFLENPIKTSINRNTPKITVLCTYVFKCFHEFPILFYWCYSLFYDIVVTRSKAKRKEKENKSWIEPKQDQVCHTAGEIKKPWTYRYNKVWTFVFLILFVIYIYIAYRTNIVRRKHPLFAKKSSAARNWKSGTNFMITISNVEIFINKK